MNAALRIGESSRCNRRRRVRRSGRLVVAFVATDRLVGPLDSLLTHEGREPARDLPTIALSSRFVRMRARLWLNGRRWCGLNQRRKSPRWHPRERVPRERADGDDEYRAGHLRGDTRATPKLPVACGFRCGATGVRAPGRHPSTKTPYLTIGCCAEATPAPVNLRHDQSPESCPWRFRGQFARPALSTQGPTARAPVRSRVARLVR